jgi:hypothetical protein
VEAFSLPFDIFFCGMVVEAEGASVVEVDARIFALLILLALIDDDGVGCCALSTEVEAFKATSAFLLLVVKVLFEVDGCCFGKEANDADDNSFDLTDLGGMIDALSSLLARASASTPSVRCPLASSSHSL